MEEIGRKKEHYGMEVFWSTPEQYFSELKAADKRAGPGDKI